MDVNCLTVMVMNFLNPSWTGGLNLFGEREYNFCTLSCKFYGIYRPRSAVFNIPLICPKCKRSSSHKWCTLLNKWKTLVEWFSKAQHRDEALSIHTCIRLTLEQRGFELCGSTYMCVFSIVNTIVLHDLLLGMWNYLHKGTAVWRNSIWRADYKL